MTHEDVINGDVVDRYVRRALPAAEAEAFEAHYFECDECFASVQAADGLRSGVRHLAAAGELADAPASPRVTAMAPRRAAMVWVPFAAAAGLAGIVAWMQHSRAEELAARLAEVNTRTAVLETTLADARGRLEALAAADPVAEGNVPLAILQTTRGPGEVQTLTVPGGALRFVLWVNAGVPRADIVLRSADGKEVARASGVNRNAEGALVAAFSTQLVRDGEYLVQQEADGRVIASNPLRIAR